jgi:hypothetical protein
LERKTLAVPIFYITVQLVEHGDGFGKLAVVAAGSRRKA